MSDKQEFDRNSWQTPKYFFRWLEKRVGWFDIDGCANEQNTLCDSWIGEGSFIPDFLASDTVNLIDDYHEDYLNGPLRIFVNPPYSDVTPFLKRAKELRDAGYLVVMLLNNDKSTQWYQQHVHNVANEVIDIVGGRVAFINPVTGEEIKGNTKGQMVVVFDPMMEDFVQRSVSLDFVKKVGNYEKA